jgi:subtilisin family serine protease
MGLEPVGAETSPPIGLLDPGTPSTYGVQYTAAQIDAVLQGVPEAMPIRHKDCWGHGTHIASIAAGDGRFAFKRVGVAPRAELIIVKILHLQNEPSNAGPDQRFKDAIAYIRNVAAALGKPCVINYSIGSHLGPHDGLTEQENWLAFEFREENAAGAIFVTAAGNDAGKRQHARLDFTAALQDIELPFELYDTRTEFTDNRTCVPKSSTKTLFLDFYYPTGVATVNFEFKPQFANVFTPGPALGSNPVNGTFFARRFRLSHRIQTDHLRERNNFRVQLDPAPIIRHVPGTYVVKIHASAPITMHVWCSQSERQGLRVGNSLPPGVTQEDKFLIGSPAGARNVITVASYDPAPNSDPNLSPTLNVADSSSRGPLARYTSVEPPPKPDIAAPGVGIKAARSRHSGIIPATQTSPRKGTSMAAPHVTGAIALLFEKFPALTPVQARQKLQDKALKDPAPVADEVGGGRLDVKATFNAS